MNKKIEATGAHSTSIRFGNYSNARELVGSFHAGGVVQPAHR
jgi:hypothetical protein